MYATRPMEEHQKKYYIHYTGVAFTENSPYFTDKYQALQKYKACPFCLRKNLLQESTCQKDETDRE